VTGMRPVLILTHAPHEGPGLIAPALDAPVRVRTVVSSDAPELPALDEISGLVVMGGAMDADDDRFPGLTAERDLIVRAVEADVPVLGICLGMQLVGLALGAELSRRHGTEIGFAPVDLVADDPALRLLGERPTVLHWHDDAVSLPPGATLLASSSTTPVQAFRLGSALALQFHPELEPGMLDLWLSTPEMTDRLGEDEIEAIRADGAKYLPDLAPAARAFVGAFAAQVQARG